MPGLAVVRATHAHWRRLAALVFAALWWCGSPGPQSAQSSAHPPRSDASLRSCLRPYGGVGLLARSPRNRPRIQLALDASLRSCLRPGRTAPHSRTAPRKRPLRNLTHLISIFLPCGILITNVVPPPLPRSATIILPRNLSTIERTRNNPNPTPGFFLSNSSPAR